MSGLRRSNLVRILDEIKSDANGAALLADWLGDGGFHVEQAEADIRASACYKGYFGKPCPNNKEPNWWEKFKTSIAMTIRKQLSLKSRLKLKAHREDEIHMCSICGCCLKLKVWTPIEHIKKHTSAEMLQRYPFFCWQRMEMSKDT